MPKLLSPRTFDNEFNVLAYGAKRDGSTDDTVAIQKAVDACQAAGGGTLLMPPGTYRTTTSIKIVGAGNMHVLGYGATMIRTTSFGTFWQNFIADGQPGATNYPGYSGPSNLKFEGLTIDVNGDTVTTNGIGFMIAHAQNITFESVTILDVINNHALDISSTKNLYVTNCTFKGFNPVTSGQESAECIQIDGSHSIVSAASYPYDDTTCDGVYVTNNVCTASDSLGGWGSFIGSHGDPPNNVYQQNLVISGNTVKDIRHYALKIFQWRDATITGNTFVSCNGGLRVHMDENSTSIDGSTAVTQSIQMSSNVFDTTGVVNSHPDGVMPAVIYVTGRSESIPIRDLIITDNIIKSYANVDGISIQYVDDVIITNNIIRTRTATTGSGDNIAITNTVGALVQNNTMKFHNGDMMRWSQGTTGAVADRSHLPCLLLFRTTDQTITTATRTAISWSSVAMNTGPSQWWASGSPTIVKLPWPGLYIVSAYAGWATHGTGSRSIYLNRTSTISTANHVGGDVRDMNTTEADGNQHFTTVIYEATAGTEYVVSARQDSGGDLAIAKWMSGQPAQAWISFTYLGYSTS